MNSPFFKILSLSLLVFAWLGACFTPTTVERSDRERTAVSRTPLRGMIPPPGTGQRDVPSLSDLFGRFQEEEIRIALLLPLSGPGESLGNAFLDAAAMALFEAYDPRLLLFPLDTGGTPEGARRAALSAAAGDVDIVIGPLFAESIRAAAPILREEGIKMIGFSNNPDVAGDGVYLLSFMPEQEVKRVIQFASEQDYGQFAALIPDSLYGEAVLEGFSEAVYLAGREITGLEIYTRDT
ncbi:MAG: penicillin-binding protein activator, partial [Sphingomonadales bacterium]